MAENQFLALLEKEKPTILNMLPPDADDRARERWWALTYELSRNASLRKCAEANPMSLLNAVKKFADWGLVPDNEEGFINVYNTKQDDGSWMPEASPEPMYKGLVGRAINADIIVHCVGDVLREGDTTEQSIGIKGRVLTVNLAPAKKGRKLIGAYAIFWLPNGLMDYELFDEDDIAAVEAASLRNARRRNKEAQLSPAWQFFRGEMSKAKVLKRGLKRMRGKRDTDAGRRFAELIAADNTRFDAETTGEELPADNMPTAVNSGGREGSTPSGAGTPDNTVLGSAGQSSHKSSGVVQTGKTAAHEGSNTGSNPVPGTKPSLKLTPDKPALGASATDEEVAELCKQWRVLHGGKLTGMSDWLLEHFECEDASELYANQIAECAEKMTETANA